jgi:DNA-binding transcriptional regulator YiaG
MQASPIACSTHSIHDVASFCYLAEAKRAMIVGTQRIFRVRMICIGIIWRSWNLKESTMAKKFSELRAKMPPEAVARSQEQAEKILAEMALGEMRRARGMSQEELASLLNVKQPSIAKLEQRTDMYISTLRDHIRALGGELVMFARFPEGDVKISTPREPDENANPAESRGESTRADRSV